MILPVTLRLRTETVTVHLAPFDEAGLSRLIPLDPATIPHETTDAIARYSTDSAANIVEARAKANRSTWWGIYDGDVSTDTLVGMVGMRPHDAYIAPDGSKPVQEIGRLIVPESARGRGIGTVVAVGAIAFSREHQGTHVVIAHTSEHNLGAGRSLEKIGFTQTEIRREGEYAGGADTFVWTLADERGQAGAPPPLAEFAPELAAGWEQYQQVLGGITIQQV